jgi:hypothetical protein
LPENVRAPQKAELRAEDGVPLCTCVTTAAATPGPPAGVADALHLDNDAWLVELDRAAS